VAGLKGGWHAFVSSVKVLLTILGALTPFVIAIGVPVWLSCGGCAAGATGLRRWRSRPRTASRCRRPRPAARSVRQTSDQRGTASPKPGESW
jgi:hypothetical protein